MCPRVSGVSPAPPGVCWAALAPERGVGTPPDGIDQLSARFLLSVQPSDVSFITFSDFLTITYFLLKKSFFLRR